MKKPTMSRAELDKKIREQELQDMALRFQRTFSTDEGKIVLNQILLGVCRMNMPTMNRQSEMATYENAVRKDVGNEILQFMRGPVKTAMRRGDPVEEMLAKVREEMEGRPGDEVLPVDDIETDDVSQRESD